MFSKPLFFFILTVALWGWGAQGGEFDYPVLTTEAIQNVTYSMGFTDTPESWTEKTDSEATGVKAGYEMVFSIIEAAEKAKQVPASVEINNTKTEVTPNEQNAAEFDNQSPPQPLQPPPQPLQPPAAADAGEGDTLVSSAEDNTAPHTETKETASGSVDTKNDLKVIIMSIGGNGASLLKPVKELIDGGAYTNFHIYYCLSYNSPLPLITNSAYLYCQKLFSELLDEKYSTKVSVFRYIPKRSTKFGGTEHQQRMLAMEAWDSAFHTKPISTVHHLPESEMRKGCIIFDGVTGTGMRSVDTNTDLLLEVPKTLIKEMGRIKFFSKEKAAMVCNDVPSGMDQYGVWSLKWDTASPLDGPVKYQVDFVLSMHWNKPFVNANIPELAKATIILLKYEFGGQSFFQALARYPALSQQLDQEIVPSVNSSSSPALIPEAAGKLSKQIKGVLRALEYLEKLVPLNMYAFLMCKDFGAQS